MADIKSHLSTTQVDLEVATITMITLIGIPEVHTEGFNNLHKAFLSGPDQKLQYITCTHIRFHSSIDAA